MREDSAAIIPYNSPEAKASRRKAAGKKAAETRKARAEAEHAKREAAAKKAAATRKRKKSSTEKEPSRRTTVAKKGKDGRKGHKLSAEHLKKMQAGRRRAARARAKGEAPKSKKAKKSGTRKSGQTAAQRRATAKLVAYNKSHKRKTGKGKKTYKTKTVHVSAPRKRGQQKRVEVVVTRRKAARRRKNPLTGGREWASGIAGFILGGAAVSFFDRLAATHPLSSGTTAGSTTTWYDTPTTGQIYNAEAVQAPLYSSAYRLLIAALGIITPFGIAAAVKGPGAKSFFQLMGFGALGVTGVKLTNDILGAILIQSPYGARLYAPEIMAQTDQTAVGATGASQLPSLSAPVHTVMPPANPPTLAGLPRQAPRLGIVAGRPQSFPTRVAPVHVAATPQQTPAPLSGASPQRLETISTYFRENN
jgi:hypothetical protein